jgi:DNA uptake protein ComE-like DNA-binding protein
MKQRLWLFLAMSLLLLAGCGGGSSSSKTTDVVVVDGYIDGAHVRDGSDKNATPIGNGVYRFTGPIEGNITASGGWFVDSNLSNLFTYVVDGEKQIISPITHFLTQHPELEDTLSQALDVEPDELYEDFMASENLPLVQLAQLLYAMEVNGFGVSFAGALDEPQDMQELIQVAKSLTPGHPRRLDIDSFLDILLEQVDAQIEAPIKDDKEAMQSGDGDSTPPTLLSSSPEDEEEGVSRFSDIELTFSEKIIGVNDSSVKLMRGNTTVSTSITHTDETVRINPSQSLSYGTTYTIELSDEITDPTGNALEPVQINFNTEDEVVIPPLPQIDPEPATRVIKTGQTKWYAHYDDGHLQRGVDHNFTDNGDGTITDNNTGLKWQKDANTTLMTYTEASNYCNDLNISGMTFWGLPGLMESKYLVDYGRSNPAINPIFTSTQSGRYWTSTGADSLIQPAGLIQKKTDDYFWNINFSTGASEIRRRYSIVKDIADEEVAYVRCVFYNYI